jgi:hypothetical protein
MKEKILSKLYKWAENFILWYDSRVAYVYDFKSSTVVSCKGIARIRMGQFVQWVPGKTEDEPGHVEPCLPGDTNVVGIALTPTSKNGNVSILMTNSGVEVTESK